MSDEELTPFWVNTNEGVYQVVDGTDQTWLETSNAVTAEHYVELLNKALKWVSAKLGLAIDVLNR